MSEESIFDRIKIQEKENRKKAIISVAHKILNESGMDAVTIRSVAESAGLSSGAIYMYFKSKEELFLGMLANRIAELQNEIISVTDDSKPIDSLKKICGLIKDYHLDLGKHINFVDFVSERGEEYKKLDPQLREELIAAMGGIFKRITKLLSTAEMKKLFKGIPPERGVVVLWAVIQGINRITLPVHKTDISMFDFDQVLNDFFFLFFGKIPSEK